MLAEAAPQISIFLFEVPQPQNILGGDEKLLGRKRLLKEIGRTLGISESRVSQVHTRAMSRLRLRLHKALTSESEAA